MLRKITLAEKPHIVRLASADYEGTVLAQYEIKPEDDNWLRQVNAHISYYLKRDPYTMSDDEWATAWNDLVWIRSEERRAHGQ